MRRGNLKEYNFEILNENEYLAHFSENELVVGVKCGGYKIYKIDGFDLGNPIFYKKFEAVTIFNVEETPENIISFKNDGKYLIYKIRAIEKGVPIFDDTFRIIVAKGKNRLEVYDTDTGITFRILPKGE